MGGNREKLQSSLAENKRDGALRFSVQRVWESHALEQTFRNASWLRMTLTAVQPMVQRDSFHFFRDRERLRDVGATPWARSNVKNLRLHSKAHWCFTSHIFYCSYNSFSSPCERFSPCLAAWLFQIYKAYAQVFHKPTSRPRKKATEESRVI